MGTYYSEGLHDTSLFFSLQILQLYLYIVIMNTFTYNTFPLFSWIPLIPLIQFLFKEILFLSYFENFFVSMKDLSAAERQISIQLVIWSFSFWLLLKDLHYSCPNIPTKSCPSKSVWYSPFPQQGGFKVVNYFCITYLPF